jgi:hypothetical protein
MILSEIMLAELLYIYRHPIKVEHSRILHQSTLKALLNRNLIARNGRVIQCTPFGEQVASKKELNKRLRDADVSDSVKALLHVSKILPFRKAS